MSSHQHEHNEFMTTTPDNSILLDTSKNDPKDSLFMHDPSCLDSPSSIKSPTSLSTTFSTPTKTSKFPVIRKLGAAEVVYDIEHTMGNVILVDSFAITSKYDLFSNMNLLNKSIYYWKQSQVLLRASIFTVEPRSQASSSSSPLHSEDRASTERYFIYANDDKVQNNENIKCYRLNVGSNRVNQKHVEEMCHETFGREFNLEFLDSKVDLLWRLTFIETPSFQDKEYSYYLVFSAHHAIADARNAHFLFLQLLDIIENVYTNASAHYSCNNHVESSIEERLFNNDPVKLANINVKENPSFNGDTCKLLDAFLPDSSKSTTRESLAKRLPTGLDFSSIKFQSLIHPHSDITLADIVTDKRNTIKIRNFVLTDQFRSLVQKCKKNNTKLTGCMNIITALATRKLYQKFTSNQELFNIHYHLLANLRPFLDPPLDNYTIGYWAVVFGLCFNEEFDLNNNDKSSWSNKFWHYAKHESDSIHEKIKNGEHFEVAKFDTLLMDQVIHGHEFPNGGGVHYALSNLGIMPSSIDKDSGIKIKNHFFGTSLQPNRWSSVIFHGLTTIDNSLSWAIVHQSTLVRDEAIDCLVDNILEIIQNIIQD